jgi:Ricin-type beta-trefoil lectin domain-like
MQSNQLWKYVPEAGNTGYGQLLGLQSGKCFEVNGTNGNVDQWDCLGTSNQLWRQVANGGLQVKSDGSYLGVWLKSEPYVVTDGTHSSCKPASPSKPRGQRPPTPADHHPVLWPHPGQWPQDCRRTTNPRPQPLPLWAVWVTSVIGQDVEAEARIGEQVRSGHHQLVDDR